MTSRGRVGPCWVLVLAAVVAFAPPIANAQVVFSDEAVEKAIEKGKKYLWDKYDQAELWSKGITDTTNYVGYSALPIYALLAASESYQGDNMKKALDWLARQETNGTYSLGLRCQIWVMLPKEIGHELLKKDVEKLIRSAAQPVGKGPLAITHGTYTYVSDGKLGGGGDHSNTQYGILGVWAGARGFLEIPKAYWEIVFRHFVLTQNPDGGWEYSTPPSGQSTPTMTAAGLASLFVAFDNLSMDRFTKVGQNPEITAIQKGLEWFDKRFPGIVGGGGYLYYGIERVGLASGYKYFGKQDWYKIIATSLINSQGGDGGWGSPVETAFSLLFLVRGRNPVLFNRLEYNGDWNNRPRGVANLAFWISRTFEREVNWQIINLQVDVEEWHDAPILLITGAKKPNFTEQDLEKLRRYVWQGGTVMTVTEGDKEGSGFESGIKEVYKKLFPEYELRALPENHPLFTAHFPMKGAVKLEAVTNGVRLLAVHCPQDLLLAWQTNAYATMPDDFKMAANIAFFATDRASLRFRGTSTWLGEGKVLPARAAKVARIRYNGNWDPEPLAWERFRRWLGQTQQTKLDVSVPLKLTEVEAEAYPVAFVTGTGTLSLTAEEKTALKKYVAGGGLVFLDAAGGSGAFGDSAAKVLEEVFGAGRLQRLAGMSGVYRQKGMDLGVVKYRRAARDRIGNIQAPRLEGVEVGNRVGVILSREDVTAGLVGYPCFTCIGYEPESALAIVRNVIFYGLRAAAGAESGPSSGPAPATAPAAKQ